MGSEVQDREFAQHIASRNSLEERYGHMRPADAPASCVRPRSEKHRATDWRHPDGGKLICGLCHPPAVPAWAS